MRISLKRLSLLEVEALIQIAHLGEADTHPWSDAECVSYGWTRRKATAAGRAIDKLNLYRDQLRQRAKSNAA